MNWTISQDLLQLINDYKGKPYNVCYKVIEETDNFARDFYFLCDLLVDHSIGHIDVPEYISAEEYKHCYHTTIVDVEYTLSDIFYKVNHESLDADQAFLQLAERFQNRFKDKKQLAVAVSLIALSNHVPFVSCGNLVEMDDAEYKRRLIEHPDQVNRLRYAIQASYAQKTERASAILNVLSSVHSANDKAVLLSQLLWMIENKKYSLHVVNSNENESEKDPDSEGMDEFLDFLYNHMSDYCVNDSNYTDYGDDYYDQNNEDDDYDI